MTAVAFFVLVAVLLTAIVIGLNVNRQRQNIYDHWYALGWHDARTGHVDYSLSNTQKDYIVAAYWHGYNAAQHERLGIDN